MQYQLLRHNKTTKSRRIGLYPEPNAVLPAIYALKLSFFGMSYIGNFPMYRDAKGRSYSVQGLADINKTVSVVCSLPEEALPVLTTSHDKIIQK